MAFAEPSVDERLGAKGLLSGQYRGTTASATPAKMPLYPLLDSVRAVAALGVFAYHANQSWLFPQALRPLASHGNFGVPVFFALSGFLVYRPFVLGLQRQERFAVKKFYRRRARRIVPAYWFALIMLAMFPGLSRFHDRWWQLFLFGQGFDPGTVFGGGIGAAWSLCIEVSFYLLLPGYAIFIRWLMAAGRARWWHELCVLSAMAGSTLLAHALIGRSERWALLGFTLPGTLYLFTSGMALAVVSVRTRWLESRVVTSFPEAFWILAIGLYVVTSYALPADDLGSVHPLYGAIAALVILPAIVHPGPRFMSFVGWWPLRQMGLISYAFYLWHHALLNVAGRFLGYSVEAVSTAFVVTCLISIFSYVVIEKPFMRRSPRPTRRPVPDHPRRWLFNAGGAEE
ncbi:acyltransferase [Dactylosporangium vinaceum]|uniref:Acyltransferase family protein n=1 Tax=Dactylosporangium vinaceum TaxID=53362 RepID=A0ABV5MII3_9ACTN|nr:acyltransferase [Dactylosporangium vinaceum]UAB97601.1 acyltransferase [Dactylosporangium vinaceum]